MQRVRLYTGLEGSERVWMDRKAPLQSSLFQFPLISLGGHREKLRGSRGQGYRTTCAVEWRVGDLGDRPRLHVYHLLETPSVTPHAASPAYHRLAVPLFLPLPFSGEVKFLFSMC